jgi:hypothetical protein
MWHSNPSGRRRGDRRGWRGATALVVCLLLSALARTPASAQTEPRERAARITMCGDPLAHPVVCLDPTELETDGWQFDPIDVKTGSIGAGFVAATTGWVFGGPGHLWIGDRQTFHRLLALQGTGAALLVSGLVLRAGTTHPAGDVGADLLTVTGGSAIAGAWAADVVGAFRGVDGGLAPNASRAPGLSMEVLYTILFGRGVAEPGVGLLRLPFVAPRARLRPRLELDVALDYQIVGVDGALRLPLGSRGTLLEWTFDAEDAWWRSDRAGWTRGAAGVSFTLDLGDLAPQLSGLWWTTGVMGQAEWARFGTTGGGRLQGAPLWTVPLEVALSMNVSRSVNLQGGYRHRRDQLPGAFSSRLGVFFAHVSVTPRDRFGVELGVEGGELMRAFAGLRFQLVTTGRERSE